MRPRVGKCPVCGTRMRLVRSRYVKTSGDWTHKAHALEVPTFVIGTHRIGDAPAGADWCPGNSMLPAADPKLDRQRARRASKRTALIEPFRAHAAVALDAELERKPYPRRDVAILLCVAIKHFEVHQPFTPHQGSPARYIAIKNSIGRGSRYGDVYCLFCGVLLMQRVRGERFGLIRSEALAQIAANNRHTVECALKHLAFNLPPVDPHTRRLPDEMLNLDQAEA